MLGSMTAKVGSNTPEPTYLLGSTGAKAALRKRCRLIWGRCSSRSDLLSGARMRNASFGTAQLRSSRQRRCVDSNAIRAILLPAFHDPTSILQTQLQPQSKAMDVLKDLLE